MSISEERIKGILISLILEDVFVLAKFHSIDRLYKEEALKGTSRLLIIL